MARILTIEELRRALESRSSNGSLTIQGSGLLYVAHVRGGIDKIDALRDIHVHTREASALLDNFFDSSDVAEVQN